MNSDKTTSDKNEQASSSDTCKFKGVRMRKWGKWVSEIRLPNSRERIWLGSFDSPEKAARAFDAAQFCLRGPLANFNFPDSLPENIGGGLSLSPQQIQVAAAKYANEFDQKSGGNCCASSSSIILSEVNVAVVEETDETTVDWSFLDVLDSNKGASNFGLYSMGSQELYGHSLPPDPEVQESFDYDVKEDDEMYGGDDFGQQSLLWNFDNVY